MVRTTVFDETQTVEAAGGLVPRPREAGTERAARLTRGATVDRYTILELVGQGGMGEVYAAYDPKLDRRIALKLITGAQRPLGDAVADARLLREAQAIAKVSHPNVVTVHDAGAVGEYVFIAMEFVDGPTLKDWLAARPRSRMEILAVFRSAARGLAAAHAAGLVHRDFKPQNVMIGPNGEARVLDFGLVRQSSATAETDDRGAQRPAEPPGPDVELTQTGDLLGTPRYMAPEQFAAKVADPRTDQFSFCIALYEALYGQRAFEGATLPELMGNVAAGRFTPPPAKAGVPGWIRRVVLRGLEVDRERRFPSMEALLIALETDTSMRGRRVAFGVGLFVILALAAFGVRHLGDSRQALCRGGQARWARVWEPGGAPTAQKNEVHRAFVATGAAYAEQAFTETSRLLGAYADRWLAMYADACEATHLRGEQSTEVLDLRMACLDERLTSASSLVDVFRTANETVVEQAFQAVGALPTLDRCSNVTLLKALVRPPDDEALRKRVAALAAEESALVAARVAGRCAEADRGFDMLLPRIRATGYLPLVAQTLYDAGYLLSECNALDKGLERLREAYTTALGSRHDEVAAKATLGLAHTMANRTDRAAEARQWLEVSEALLQRFDNHPVLDTWRLGAEGLVLVAEGRGEEAIATTTRGLALRRRVQGENHPETLIAANDLGLALEGAGRYEEALATFAETRQRTQTIVGAHHPRTATVSYNEGEVLNLLGRHAEARVAIERALEVWRRSRAQSTFLAYGLTGLGIATLGQGRPDEAVPLLEEALALRATSDARRVDLGETRFALARALWAEPARRARARALAQQARADVADSKLLVTRRLRGQIDAWLENPGQAPSRK